MVAFEKTYAYRKLNLTKPGTTPKKLPQLSKSNIIDLQKGTKPNPITPVKSNSNLNELKNKSNLIVERKSKSELAAEFKSNADTLHGNKSNADSDSESKSNEKSSPKKSDPALAEKEISLLNASREKK